MKGQFKQNYFLDAFGLAASVFIVGLMSFILATTDDLENSLIDGIMMIAIFSFFAVFFVFSIIFKKKVYFTVKDNHISAQFFKKLECDIDEVTYIACNFNMLTIEVNNKTYTIIQLENSYALYTYIKQRIKPFQNDIDKNIYTSKIEALSEKRKIDIGFMCFFMTATFASIILSVMYTPPKDVNFSEYTKQELIIVVAFMLSFFLFMIIALVLATKAGKKLRQINNYKSQIVDYSILKTPLLPGNVLRVYMYASHSGRITIFGFPYDDRIYFASEAVSPDFNLVKTYTSPIYENINELQGELEEYIDITDYFNI